MKSWAEYKQELVSKHSTPHQLALGFAVGTFIGILPTPFISIFLALFALFLYPKMSKATLFGAIVLWNPLVTVPLSVVSIRIGDILFGAAPPVHYDLILLNTLYNFSRRFLIGNLILSTSCSIVGYAITFLLSAWWRRSHPK